MTDTPEDHSVLAADRAIREYQAATGVDAEDVLSDLLADLQHWAKKNNYDFEAALIRAQGHYDAEQPKEIVVEVEGGVVQDVRNVPPGYTYTIVDHDNLEAEASPSAFEPVIYAEAHTDDYLLEPKFDAAPWFEQASDADILALAGCGWGGDYPADEVAMALRDRDGGLQAMFAYLDTIRDLPLKKDACGFECRVDEDDAMAWLKQHRPHLVAEIERMKEPNWQRRMTRRDDGSERQP